MKKRGQEVHVPSVVFLCEQDGIPERDLKTKLLPLLNAQLAVSRAYLARVSYGNSNAPAVALCMRCTAEPKQAFVESITQVFVDMFNKDAFLDILLLEKEQEDALSKVCSPFFIRDCG